MTNIVYNKNGIPFDIDAIATDLNGKADVDLVNVNDSGTSRGAGWAMPSRTSVSLTLGASGSSYTAPANGYFSLASIFDTTGVLYMYRGIPRIGISIPYSSNTWTDVLLPVVAGDEVVVQYNGTASVQSFYFIYANGEAQ